MNKLTIQNIGSVVAYNGIVHVLYQVGEHECVIRNTNVNKVELLRVNNVDIDVLSVNVIEDDTLAALIKYYQELQAIAQHKHKHQLIDIYNMYENNIMQLCVIITDNAIQNIHETLEGC